MSIYPRYESWIFMLDIPRVLWFECWRSKNPGLRKQIVRLKWLQLIIGPNTYKLLESILSHMIECPNLQRQQYAQNFSGAYGISEAAENLENSENSWEFFWKYDFSKLLFQINSVWTRKNMKTMKLLTRLVSILTFLNCAIIAFIALRKVFTYV